MRGAPRPVRELSVRCGGQASGTLRRASQYEYTYAPEADEPISLIMPVSDQLFRDGDLFAVMDMNLPEGFLLARLRERFPKEPPTKMQLLSLMGSNGIGRLAYDDAAAPARPTPRPVSRARLLREGSGRQGASFRRLVEAYLSTGSGLSGVQPKILLPERATIPVPNLLVKTASADLPDLAANEFLCLEVARRLGTPVAQHELSDDGTLLVLDRFDLDGEQRLGFEDLAALLDLRVGGALSDRKYRGSYQAVARLLELFCSAPAQALSTFFDHLCVSVMVRNGDAHLKNFGLLYTGERRWLAPLFDVVTTSIYAFERAGRRVTDRTMALKLSPGTDRSYPSPASLADFGRTACRVKRPEERIHAVAAAMEATLAAAAGDARIPPRLLRLLAEEWNPSVRRAHALRAP